MIKCRTEISKKFSFESAHFLPNVPKGHKCARMHGHSFKATVTVCGPVDKRLGWVMDFAELKKIVKPYIDELDHNLLNDVKGLKNPTSENVAGWLAKRISKHLSEGARLAKIEIAETCESSCTVYVES